MIVKVGHKLALRYNYVYRLHEAESYFGVYSGRSNITEQLDVVNLISYTGILWFHFDFDQDQNSSREKPKIHNKIFHVRSVLKNEIQVT